MAMRGSGIRSIHKVLQINIVTVIAILHQQFRIWKKLEKNNFVK